MTSRALRRRPPVVTASGGRGTDARGGRPTRATRHRDLSKSKIGRRESRLGWRASRLLDLSTSRRDGERAPPPAVVSPRQHARQCRPAEGARESCREWLCSRHAAARAFAAARAAPASLVARRSAAIAENPARLGGLPVCFFVVTRVATRHSLARSSVVKRQKQQRPRSLVKTDGTTRRSVLRKPETLNRF